MLPAAMTRLVELVGQYRNARNLDERNRAGDGLLRLISTDLHLFLAQRIRAKGIQGDCLDDMLQETLVSIVRGLETFNGNSDKEFWAWCYGIARHKLGDQWRRQARNQLEFVDSVALQNAIEATAHAVPISRSEGEALEWALDLLKAVNSPCVDYLWLRYVLDWDHKTIAEAYGLNPNSMHVKIKRCLETARSVLLKTKGAYD